LKNHKADGGNSERAVKVKQLYANNWARIIEACHESNSNLQASDAYDCVSRLEDKLQYYPAKLSDDAFCEWAANVLAASVFICALRSECEPHVYRAILTVFATCDGLGVDDGAADEIASDVWMWALAHADDLMKPSPTGARLTTRIYGRARWAARSWKTMRLREKSRYASLDDAEAAQEALYS
jgi:hypothetical protein